MHGPVIGYGKVDGRTVAVSRKRASFGQDILFQLPFRDLTLNKVDSAKTFIKTMARSPFTFNTGYADDRDIAMFSAGQAAEARQARRPAPPHQGHRASTSGRASSRPARTRSRSNPPTG